MGGGQVGASGPEKGERRGNSRGGGAAPGCEEVSGESQEGAAGNPFLQLHKGPGANYTPLKASLLALSYSHKPEIGGLAPAEPVLGLAGGGHWKPNREAKIWGACPKASSSLGRGESLSPF